MIDVLGRRNADGVLQEKIAIVQQSFEQGDGLPLFAGNARCGSNRSYFSGASNTGESLTAVWPQEAGRSCLSGCCCQREQVRTPAPARQKRWKMKTP